MKIIHIDDTVTTRWSGGTTTQLMIWPEGASYADRNFLFRLSSAVVEDEESVFTSLPDYHRFLSIRKGELQLRHDDGDWYNLPVGQVTSFDGGSQTVSCGRVTDYNLMIRKGKVTGGMKAVRCEGGRLRKWTELFPEWEAERQKAEKGGETIYTLFLSEGTLLRLTGSSEALLHTGEMAVFEGTEEISHVWLDMEQDGIVIGTVCQSI